ncbi:hypothetical protein [Kineosporia babensis]|uniref:Uncharacterized protein n=1 Tax=Kineosporia babensis TaxID=499548 RepID=A0A9X1NB40_9ACTN|nr:hypothetical protein [Kineosporia babensis]MCD5310853.1 hypothetical protein [Kineosporia babensis]
MKHIAAAIGFVAVAFVSLAVPVWMWIRPLVCVIHLVIVESRKGNDDTDEDSEDDDAPADDKTEAPA